MSDSSETPPTVDDPGSSGQTDHSPAGEVRSGPLEPEAAMAGDVQRVAEQAGVESGESSSAAAEGEAARRRILIGSQRDPASYRPKPKRDWAPTTRKPKPRRGPRPAEAGASAASSSSDAAPDAPAASMPAPLAAEEEDVPPVRAAKRFPPPNLRDRLSPELEREFEQVLGDMPVEEMMAAGAADSPAPLEPDTRHQARVIAVRRDDVFVELGSRQQGIVPLRLLPAPPAEGSTLEVTVLRFNAEDGLYELSLPGAAAAVADWGDLADGMLVEARITGHNAGGLECEVNHIRGFIPISQVALYRVQELAEFVGQKFACLVTEADPQRGNLVLSRRAVLEREKEEAKKTLLESLAPGQIREGVVRKLMDFGAFVELGNGVDGLLHVSQLGWGRVKHPSEVLQEGQTIRVRIEKVHPQTRKISLAYRDLLENPWEKAAEAYQSNTVVKGRVVKIMEFGAFVELEPGIEGLVHISELSPKRVARVADVVKEGEEIQAVVLSVDKGARRISLSMKGLAAQASEAEAAASESAPAAAEKPRKGKPSRPLQGGLGRVPGAARLGLNW